MGMDVYAKRPLDPALDYFRANVWRWRGIHKFMSLACKDIYGNEIDNKMAYNEGAGIPEELVEDCADAMQDLFDKDFKSLDIWSPYPKEDHYADSYLVPTARLQDWINFVRNSGGFEVW